MITRYSKILFLRVVWKENGMLERGNRTPLPVGIFRKLKKLLAQFHF